MHPILLPKRTLIILAMTVIATSLGIFVLTVLLPIQPQTRTSKYSSEDQEALSAAINGVETFFTVDYREGKNAWLKKVCEKSTTSGCQFISQGIDPLWEKISSSQSVINAKAKPIEKVAENASEQVWVIATTLSLPFPGSNKTKDQAYVSVEKTGEGWKFGRFLLPGEIKALQERRIINTDQKEEEKKQ